VSAFGAGLRALGLNKNDCVGIMSMNRAEWVITDLVCACQSFLSVPLYDTLGPDATHYIVNHASVRAVVVSKEKLGEVCVCCAPVQCVECIAPTALCVYVCCLSTD
jgi:long-chain acyl-CoA synthetase